MIPRHAATVLVLAIATSVASGSGPASAHTCSLPIEVPVDERSRVDVSVVAEAVEVVGVEVDVPEAYRLEGRWDQAGWDETIEERLVSFTGGRMEPYSCEPFSLTGVATGSGKLTFPVTVHYADGTSARFDSDDPADHGSAQLVYAGGRDAAAAPEADHAEEGTSRTPLALVLVGGAVTAAGVVLVRRRARRVAAG